MFWTAIGALITIVAMGTVGTCAHDRPHVSQPERSTTSAQANEPDDAEKTSNDAPFVLHSQSTVTLAGGATVGAWDCESDQVDGTIAPHADADAIAALFDRLQQQVEADGEATDLSIALPDGYEPESRVRVPVRSFKSGDSRMERDMYEALKAEDHPNIAYRLTAIEAIELVRADADDKNDADQVDEDDKTSDRPAPALRLATHGELLLAGVTRTVEMEVLVRRIEPDRWTLLGRKALKMSDFNITPPSAFFGLIRAHDTVEVTFDLHLQRTPSRNGEGPADAR